MMDEFGVAVGESGSHDGTHGMTNDDGALERLRL